MGFSDIHQDQQRNNKAYIAELETKLTIAIQALQEIEDLAAWNDHMWRTAVTALEKINNES
jgi:hypothetical protein